MGLLGDLLKDVTREAKWTLKSELRSETRQAVRGAIRETKEGIGKAGQAVADGVSGQNQQPQVLQTQPTAPAPAPAPANNIGDAAANATAAAQPAAQMMNAILNNDSPLGKLANAAVMANKTEEEKAEIKEGLATMADPEKSAEMQQALRDHSAEIEAAMKQSGVNVEAATNAMNESAEILSK